MKINAFFDTGWRGDLIALCAGAMLTLAFAPFSIFPLAIISPALLLFTWLKVSPDRGFFRGWLYGIGLFSTGVYWIFISVNTFGEAPWPLALFITAGLISIISLFPALTGFLINNFYPRNNDYKILLAFPSIWVFLEWSRSWLFTGFPWLSIGYSQINSFLKGYAPVGGIYSVSFVTILSAGLFAQIILKIKQSQRSYVYRNVAILFVIWLTGGILSFIHWTSPVKNPVQVSLIQGNIPQQLKWNPDQVQPTLDHYTELTNPNWKSDIVIWPEGAIPIPLQSAKEFVQNLDKTAKEHGTTFITGIPIGVKDENGYYNSVIAVGNGYGVYLKKRLVPFGEFTPNYKILQAIMNRMNIPMSDFVPGKPNLEPLEAKGLKIATFICYEIAFPEQVNSPRSDIDMLLTVSNDAWFGKSIAQAQHLEMAQMRSLELGRPGLFVSNDGITAIIKPNGKIQAEAPTHVSYSLTGKVQPYEGLTPWQKGKIDPLLILMIFSLVYGARQNRQLNKQELP